MITKKVDCINLGIKPTPIQKLENISKEYGCEIYIKRDDLIGVGLGGNKVRKLEYLLKEAKDRGAKVVYTNGALQTNHGMLTATCASKLGMKCLLFLKKEDEREIEKLSGNLLLDDYIGCDVTFIDLSNISDSAKANEKFNEEIEKHIEEYKAKHSLKDEEVYNIPFGGSTPLGILGYSECIKEIMEQDSDFEYIFSGNGSGGTYGGVFLGCKLYAPNTTAIGVNVMNMPPDKRTFIKGLIDEALNYYDGKVQIDESEMKLLSNSINEGYAIPDQETINFIKKMARSEGIFLDPVYSGKIFNGALKYIEENLKDSGKKILIIHSGGLPGLFNEPMVDFCSKSSEVLKIK